MATVFNAAPSSCMVSHFLLGTNGIRDFRQVTEYGSFRLHIGPDGNLYVSMGGEQNRSGLLLLSILRRCLPNILFELILKMALTGEAQVAADFSQ